MCSLYVGYVRKAYMIRLHASGSPQLPVRHASNARKDIVCHADVVPLLGSVNLFVMKIGRFYSFKGKKLGDLMKNRDKHFAS